MRIRSVSLLIALAAVVICTSTAMAFTPVNIAPDATATGSPQLATYTVDRINDEVINAPTWTDGIYIGTVDAGTGASFFQLDWTEDVTFQEVKIYQFGHLFDVYSYFNLWDFDISIDDGLGNWDIVESVRGGTASLYTWVSPTPLTTSKLRFDVITANNEATPLYTRVVELEVMSAVVPEPMTISLLAMGSLAMLRRRRN